MSVSIVPEGGQTVYQVLDDLGKFGHVWRELTEDETNEEAILQGIVQGQFTRPLRVVAFNTHEGWSRDTTLESAWKILEMSHHGTVLSPAATEFVGRMTGESPVVAV